MNSFFDSNNKKSVPIKLIAYSLIGANIIYIYFFTWVQNKNNDGYILGDWLINYEDGGFKRRGLSGSLFFLIQDIFNIPLNIIVIATQYLIFTFFFFYLIKLLKQKDISISFISLMISPLAFLAYFNCVDYVGKKEFIYLAMLSYLGFKVAINKLSKTDQSLLLVFISISMFFHEIILFFIPYILILIFINDKKVNWKKFLLFFLSVFIPAIVILFFGSDINNGKSLEILESRGVVLKDGIFFWELNELNYIKDHWKEYILYIFSIIISIVHITWYFKNNLKHEKKIGLFILLAFIYSIPLFLLAIDWGRWMYLHFISITIIFMVLLPKSSDNISNAIKIQLNKQFYIAITFIIISLLYRVEMSGKGLTTQGFIYRVFIAQNELIDKVL